MSFRPTPHAHEPVSHAQLNDRLGHYVTEAELKRRLQKLWDYVLGQTDQITLIGEQLVSDQDQLNALAQALNDLAAKEASDDSALNAAAAALQAEITALQNQPAGTPLDFTGVNTALASVQSAAATNASDIAAVAAMVPAPPAPPAGG